MSDFLIIRLSSLGDILHTLPAYSALRKSYPEARITWLVEHKGREVLDCVPGLDRVVTVEAKRWALGSRNFWRALSRLKVALRGRAQTALDFQGLVKSGFLTWYSRSARRIGFHRNNCREPLASVFYSERLEEIPEGGHVISKNLKLLERIGIQEDSYDFPLSIPEAADMSVNKTLNQAGYTEGKKLIVCNVGAAWTTKRWHSDRWAAVITRLTSEREDIFPLILWGTEDEKILAEKVKADSGAPVTEHLSIKEVMALIGRAALVISGDTFALQAACALKRPLVGIFGPTNPQRNGPFRPQDRVAFHELDCSGCYLRTCPDPRCIDKVTAEEVAALSLERLEDHA